MNDIIKKIEDAQLKESVADFNVGDIDAKTGRHAFVFYLYIFTVGR